MYILLLFKPFGYMYLNLFKEKNVKKEKMAQIS